MADTFVSTLWGDDGNDGLTIVTAKATIQAGQDASSNGSTIFVFPGVYVETVFSSKIGGLFQAVGKAILDGGNAVTIGFSPNDWDTGIQGFEIKNFTAKGIRTFNHTQLQRPFQDLIIKNCSIGIELRSTTANDGGGTKNCVFDNCTVGISNRSQNSSNPFGHRVTECTFYKCQTGFEMLDATFTATNIHSQIVKNNIFDNCDIAFKYLGPSSELENEVLFQEFNYNLYNIGSGQVLATASDATYSGLIDWNTATQYGEFSQEDDPLFANPDKGIFSVLPGSPVESGSDEAGYIGARKTEIGWYNKTLLESGASFSSVESFSINDIEGLKLEQGAISGIVELNPIDIGQSVRLETILDSFIEDINNGKVIDLDVLDNTLPSGALIIEFKVADSLGALSSGAYIEQSLREPLSPVLASGGQFIQARLTFNR